MTTLISGSIALISGIVFIISLAIPRAIKVGDVFVHANPGEESDPTIKPAPFSLIYEVVEIKKGKARIKGFYIHVDGKPLAMSDWWAKERIGIYDKRVSN